MLWGAQGKAKRWQQKVMIFYNFFKQISRPSDYEDSAVEVIENTEEDAEERLKLLIYLTFLPRSK